MLYRNMRRRRLCGVVASILTCGLAGVASADAIPGITSLQDLINLGSQPASGVQIGPLVYYNFTYSGSIVGSAPTPTQISVTSARPADGLRFAYSWTSAAGSNQSSLISYSVKPVAANPQTLINNAGLDFQSTVSAAGILDNASVTESFTDSSTFTPIDSLNWFNANGTVNGVDQQQHALAFTSPSAGLRVTNGIAVHTANGSTGSSAISYVDNVFNGISNAATPEPAMMILPAMIGLTLRRRRNS